ncbi:hypothetical protein SAMN05444266_110192 [Chitinophaga jiangningensis]|uniref:Uncharacterized protein n=1 Tax=Chitinophaga jiangningensis TaxID=1419482 RepID=A0A1M7L911_9BACT|nr:hypothetical protein SAMN05444266_110192 [Chitinophaga jiangningensis]
MPSASFILQCFRAAGAKTLQTNKTQYLAAYLLSLLCEKKDRSPGAKGA